MPDKGLVIVVMSNLSDANLGPMIDGIRDAVLGSANKP
jgi:hypothetical protein